MDQYLLSDKILFNERPDAVPYNYRISYKIAQIVLILFKCGGRSSCSLVKISIIAMSLYTPNNQEVLIRLINNEATIPIIRLDPSINRALLIAIADALVVQMKNEKFGLTPKGKLLANKILNDPELMKDEKKFLDKISLNLTEQKIESIIKSWGN